ncbi:MAG: phosphoribosylamine--glycine ligase [Deltaproteobacteria bacterium]|nr:phosphoribosylamine--glycine ligase [Deltaproteobacteria bacterium]
MKVLVVGGGGREHALCWKIHRSPRVRELYCAPGNGGIADVARCVPIAADDVVGLCAFALEKAIDLTVVGPERALTLGLVDELEKRGRRAFGPRRDGARLEGSKVFAKQLLEECRVPTAKFGVFREADAAERFVRANGAPLVVKADGLAAGKGVFVCATEAEALAAVDEILRARRFGSAGSSLVIEECLEGEEASFLALTDGETVLPLASSQDHKRIFDGDRGPNTGGMGAYSPAPVVTTAVHDRVMRRVMAPVVAGLRSRGIRYQGVLYAGLMIREGEPKVLEFNARFGDPECQALLVRLESDLVEVMLAAAERRLAGQRLHWDPRPSVCVVLAAEGYPGDVAQGDEISGLEQLRDWRHGVVFHAGTTRRDGRLVTAGGRVLGVTALGATLGEAVDHAYRAAGAVRWRGMQYRKDIGARALGRLS